MNPDLEELLKINRELESYFRDSEMKEEENRRVELIHKIDLQLEKAIACERHHELQKEPSTLKEKIYNRINELIIIRDHFSSDNGIKEANNRIEELQGILKPEPIQWQ